MAKRFNKKDPKVGQKIAVETNDNVVEGTVEHRMFLEEDKLYLIRTANGVFITLPKEEIKLLD